MNKKTSKQTKGGQAAKPAAKLITLEELRADRARLETLARQHALEAALHYYFPALANDPDQRDQLIAALQLTVFKNWLEENIFSEDFKPLQAIFLN